MFLYDAPLKLTLDHAQSVFLVICCIKRPVPQVPRVSVLYRFDCTSYFTYTYMQYLFICLLYTQKIIASVNGHLATAQIGFKLLRTQYLWSNFEYIG